MIESLVILKASDNKTIPYLKSFITVLMDELSLTGKDIFRDANNTGYSIGIAIKKKETNYKRLKKFLFDFRRRRRPEDLLDLLNLLQAHAETTLYNTDAFISPETFDMAKTGFLIGFSNAIIRK